MTLNQVRPLVINYQGFGNEEHFSIGGNKITSFSYTRQQIVNSKGDDGIFAIWCLTETENQEHINVVITDVILTDGQPNIGNSNNYVLPKSPLNTNNLVMDQTICPEGSRIPLNDLRSGHQKYLTSLDRKQMRDVENKKIKAYHITNEDLTDIGINEPLTSENKNDTFALIPMIREKNIPTGTFGSPFLSIAIGELKNSRVQCVVREYCDPCPSACGNYHELF